MILQALAAHYEALVKKGEIASPGWEKVKISYALEIGEDGSFLGLLPLKTQSEDGKKLFPREFGLPARRKSGSKIISNFLWDNAIYFLGIGDITKPERVYDCFQTARTLHLELLSELETPFAAAICRFFDHWDAKSARENPVIAPFLEDLSGGANLVFFFQNQYPQEDREICNAWQQFYDDAEEGDTMRCLVTGKESVPAAIHPAIKGIKDAQPAGAALVSFNAPSNCSFGRAQNLNAPVSKSAAFAYTAALNHLLADRAHLKRIGDASVVYWAEEPEEAYQDLFSGLLDGENTTVSNRDLDDAMREIASGNAVNWEGANIKPENRFYVLALAPNAARLSVRFFLRDSFGSIVRNLQEHYARIKVVTDNRNKFENIPLWVLLRETVNEKSKDKTPSPQMAGDTLRAILTGARYPATLYQQCQIRIRAERTVTRGRAAILKAYLLQNTENQNYREALTVELNEQSTYQPYILGRLFAVLEEIQNEASGVTTIKDKYFTSACATPAVVFPMIMNLGEKHQRKLEKPGQKIYYAKQIGALTQLITSSYPAHHNLYDQGIFQLGYYHQTQKRYQKKNNTEKKEEGNENV